MSHCQGDKVTNKVVKHHGPANMAENKNEIKE